MTGARVIRSPANLRIKAAIALRDRSEREARGLTIVDGVRELGRAVAAGVNVSEAFVCPGLVDTPAAAALVEALRTAGAPITEVSEVAFGRLAFGDRAEGVVGLVRIPPDDLDRLDVGPNPLVVVLEGVEKPGNIGAVLRSADGAGADAVIVADPRTDPYNPNVIRASVGTVFSVPVAVATARLAREWLDERAVKLVAARVDGVVPYTAVDLRGPTALVLGAEVSGLGEVWTGPDVTSVRVPMHGVADSLNVSVTAAILLYEARRQRSEGGEP